MNRTVAATILFFASNVGLAEDISVSDANFAQAETAHNFANWAKLGADREIFHYREMAPIGHGAPTIRMNWDTLYSNRIVKVSDDHTFTLFMPDSDFYQAAQVIDENGFAPYYIVEKGKAHTITIDTDYAWVLFRTEVKDRHSESALKAVHAAQDGILVSGMMADSRYTAPEYNQSQLTTLREVYKKEFLDSGMDFTFAKKSGDVPQHILNLSHAAGWGGAPAELLVSNAYSSSPTMSGTECMAVTFEDPHNKFFTSFTLYDAQGYLMDGETYINSHVWKSDADGRIVLHFNCAQDATNSLSTDGKDFNYTIRNYGVSQYVLDGKFKPVHPKPVKSS